MEQRYVEADGWIARFYYDESKDQSPSIIVLSGSEGGLPFRNDEVCIETLVDSGYAVLALAYFDYHGLGDLPKKLKHIPLEYFATAMDWLAKQPEVSKSRCAVIGISRGGELALLLASYYSRITVVIALVPSAYVWGAFDRRSVVFGSAWTFQGEEIPCISNIECFFSRPWWRAIDKPERVARYFIPVEKMSAAVLLLSGKHDQTWPSTEMSNRIMERLKQCEYPYPYEHIAYDSGHSLEAQCWQDILVFLDKHYLVSS